MTASLSHIFMIEMISLCECVLDLEGRVNIIDIFLIMCTKTNACFLPHPPPFLTHTHTHTPQL